MGPLTEIHQCEVDAPMVFRLWMGNLKNGGYLRRPHHHHHQITCAFSGELARLHVAGERMGLGILENLSHDVNL